MFVESPKGSKNPVGAITPNSFSYPICRAEVRAPLFTGANAAAVLRRVARKVNFIIDVGERILVPFVRLPCCNASAQEIWRWILWKKHQLAKNNLSKGDINLPGRLLREACGLVGTHNVFCILSVGYVLCTFNIAVLLQGCCISSCILLHPIICRKVITHCLKFVFVGTLFRSRTFPRRGKNDSMNFGGRYAMKWIQTISITKYTHH